MSRRRLMVRKRRLMASRRWMVLGIGIERRIVVAERRIVVGVHDLGRIAGIFVRSS